MTYAPPATGMPDPLVLSSITPAIAATDQPMNQSVSAGTSMATNQALFVPVRLSGTHTYVKAWWLNGATNLGNTDVGIYTLSGTTLTRIAASTAEAQSGVSVMQVAATFPTTTVGPGLFYLAISTTISTATYWRMSVSSGAISRTFGNLSASSASPLPATVTAAVSTVATIPVFGLSEVAAI